MMFRTTILAALTGLTLAGAASAASFEPGIAVEREPVVTGTPIPNPSPTLLDLPAPDAPVYPGVDPDFVNHIFG